MILRCALVLCLSLSAFAADKYALVAAMGDRFIAGHEVIHTGSRLPAWVTSMGRVLLAWAPATVVADVVRRSDFEHQLTPTTIRTAAELEAELARVRDQGYALTGEELETGLITLDPDEILPLARERGLGDDLAVLAGHPRVRELVQSVVDEANELVSQPARIKRFAVLDRDFTMADGELTPTLKLKRAIAYANHAAMIEELYASR